jgi:asparagine synthase (glutamine-hydrolysing)
MADAIATDHRHLSCSSGEIASRFAGVIRSAEVPLTRTGPVAMHALSSHVHATGCKVVLTGEGADEVFGGYDLFKEAKVRAFCARQRSSTRRPQLLQRLYPSFDFTRTQPASVLAAYFSTATDDPCDRAFSHRTRWAAGPVVEQLLTPEFRARFSPSTPADRALASMGPELDGLGLLERAQLLEARTLLPSYILCSQSDRVLMAHSVEGRFPYLDHRVIEFANRLDPRLKVRVLNEKFLLKRAAAGLVPESILRRPKQPYRGPDATAFLGPGRPAYVDDLLSPAAVASSGYFEPRRVEQLTRKISVAARERRPVTHRDSLSLLTVLSTQIWHALFQTPRGWA